MALLVCAGLFTKSLMNVSRVELGINVEHLATFGVSPELNGYSAERSKQLFERLEDELAAQPGVTSVTAALVPALGGSNWGTDVSVEGFKAGPDTDTNSRFNEVAPDYFKTMGIPMLAGREFTRADKLGGAEGRDRQRERSRRSSTSGPTPSASGSAPAAQTASSTWRSSASSRTPKYSEVKDAIPPLFFQPYRQDERVGSLDLLRSHVRRAGTDRPDDPACRGDASIRTCRSRTSGR